MTIIETLEKEQMKPSVPKFRVGDTVDVHVKIIEGDKERIQVFSGTVIARRGRSIRETFTVRRIVQGEGVERLFQLHSPKVVDIKVAREGKVRRAKLFYLRKRVGKATRVEQELQRAEEAPAQSAEAPKAQKPAAKPKAEEPAKGAK
ncbi:MAG: 50S ribosomal protein L19 [Planctomycetes bacterium]|nr:50S ribosomal protein L19 [Planctomycetota bacterium]MBM4086822.1 50S ribosomal protein L19 [Planctomycetota bacterium]